MIEREDEPESMQIEINSFKFSQNKDFLTCITGILVGIIESSTGKLSEHFEKWSQILALYISSDAEKLHALKELESLVFERPEQNQFHLIVKVLYESDIVDEDCILAWNQSSNCGYLKQLVISK